MRIQHPEKVFYRMAGLSHNKSDIRIQKIESVPEVHPANALIREFPYNFLEKNTGFRFEEQRQLEIA